MKFSIFFLLASLAAILVSSDATAEDSDKRDLAVEDAKAIMDEFASAFSPFSNSELIDPESPGAGEPYRRCVKIRCPTNCTVCICRCIKWR